MVRFFVFELFSRLFVFCVLFYFPPFPLLMQVYVPCPFFSVLLRLLSRRHSPRAKSGSRQGSLRLGPADCYPTTKSLQGLLGPAAPP